MLCARFNFELDGVAPPGAVWTFCTGRSAVILAQKAGFSLPREVDFLTFGGAAITF
jgi:hypothetical protein